MNPTQHFTTPEHLASAIAEAVELGKRDARAGVVDRQIDDMPEGLEVAFDSYVEALEAEILVMGLEAKP